MKVIEPGRPQKGWSIEHRCTGKGNGDRGCDALLLVEEDDLFMTTSSVRVEITYYKTFRCPECGVMTDLENTSSGQRVVPSHVKVVSGVRHPEGGWCHPKDLPDDGK